MENPKFAAYLKEHLGYLPEITGSEEDKQALLRYVIEQKVEKTKKIQKLKNHVVAITKVVSTTK